MTPFFASVTMPLETEGSTVNPNILASDRMAARLLSFIEHSCRKARWTSALAITLRIAVAWCCQDPMFQVSIRRELVGRWRVGLVVEAAVVIARPSDAPRKDPARALVG